jgi:hypothetical protein
MCEIALASVRLLCVCDAVIFRWLTSYLRGRRNERPLRAGYLVFVSSEADLGSFVRLRL